MYQLIKTVLETDEDKTPRLWLIYCNKTEQDILLRKELDELQARFKDRLTIDYVLERPPSDEWHQGYVSEALVRRRLEGDQGKRMVFVCGPDAMLAHVSGQRARDFSQGRVTGILGRLGLPPSQVFKLE